MRSIGNVMPCLATITGLALAFVLTPSVCIAGVENFAVIKMAPSPPARSVAQNRAVLLKGVDGIRAPGGLAATLTLLGETAFPVVTGLQSGERAPVVAAARAAKGRVVVYGHGAFISARALADADTARLLTNAVRWSAADRSERGTPLRVGLLQSLEAAPTLKAAGFDVIPVTRETLTPTGLAAVDVLVGDTNAFAGAQGKERAAAVQNWVRRGGGLITFGVGWGWQQLNPGASLANDSGFNRLLVPLADIGVNSGTADPTGTDGAFSADGIGLDVPGAGVAITRLEGLAAGRTALAPDAIRSLTRVLVQAADVLPDNDARFLPRLRRLISKAGPVVPTKYTPISLNQPLARIAAVFQARELAQVPIDQVVPHPSAAAFPGAVPAEAPRIASRTLTVDTRVPEWHSTGLYAAPGETITVNVPPSAVGKGIGLRIGAHKDTLWNVDTWTRFPEITVEKKLNAESMKIASAFGGTIYVVVPNNSKLGTVPVTVSGAVAQPYFVKGKTTAAEWEALRAAPAPWADIQGDRVIITVPSTVIRNLKDPAGVADYWDQVADAAADLYGIPRERKRQERFCVDIQISAGYMHSGYPIMTHDDVDRSFVNLSLLRGTDGNKTWGFYHELGHNHQQPEWTWSGLGEVTNNLFSLYAGEQLNGVDADYSTSHGAVVPATRRARLTQYLAKGVSLEGMNSDPFLTLTFFIQLRQAFGWEPFKKVFAEYHRLPDAERPRTEREKHDQFLIRFSRAVGRNLGPFFTAWGLPTSETAQTATASLPEWMPADWPASADLATARQEASSAGISAR